jgi:antagonist of KipI
METIEVLEPGLFTTVQDLGRYGYQRYGVPVSGALDPFALRVANLLVANDEGEAGLEITLVGPQLLFLADAVIALTGGDLRPELNGRPRPMWQAVLAPRGSVLAFAGAREGVRSYLAIAGGIDVPPVLGSRSTYVRGRFGGLDGRPLRKGDRLHVRVPAANGASAGRTLPAELVPRYSHEPTVRVVLGPQDDAFTERGIRTFLSAPYTVTPESDRMGYRLEGPRIEHKAGPDIVSDGTPLGAVQVTGDGMPIILLADRGTTGGYTKIATVITVDIPKLAQAAPEDRVFFQAISIAEAHQLLRQQAALLQQLRAAPPMPLTSGAWSRPWPDDDDVVLTPI